MNPENLLHLNMDDPTAKKLLERMDRLENENKRLRKRVEELEKRLMQYEGPNSPSSAKPIYKKRSKSDKKSSGRTKKRTRKRKGRKKGHKGTSTRLGSGFFTKYSLCKIEYFLWQSQ